MHNEDIKDVQVVEENVDVCEDDKVRKKSSNVWKTFTILDKHSRLASCDICGLEMSYKTTTSNLKKHTIRKHSDMAITLRKYPTKRVTKFKPSPYKIKHNLNKPRPKLTELTGLDGLLLNVVADEGNDPMGDEEVSPNVEEVEETLVFATEEDMHNYSVISGSQVTSEEKREKQREPPAASYTVVKNSHPQTSRIIEVERRKRNEIMDLQLDCLRIKKYNMKLEALMLEHQLNLPRSVYTEKLRGANWNTKGTQTDVGGNNTKVFYVSDSILNKDSSQHFFTFQAHQNPVQSQSDEAT